MKETILESHQKEVPGRIFNLPPESSLKLVFTSAPGLNPNTTTVVSLEHPASKTIAYETLSHGESSLGLILDQSDFAVDLEMAQKLEDKGFSKKAAVQTALIHNIHTLAQNLAEQFFKSAQDVTPKLCVTSEVHDDGSYRVDDIRILMVGKSNHHPFWQAPSV